MQPDHVLFHHQLGVVRHVVVGRCRLNVAQGTQPRQQRDRAVLSEVLLRHAIGWDELLARKVPKHLSRALSGLRYSKNEKIKKMPKIK
jgi:hypothetical protein